MGCKSNGSVAKIIADLKTRISINVLKFSFIIQHSKAIELGKDTFIGMQAEKLRYEISV